MSIVMNMPEPRAEFRSLSKEDVAAALRDSATPNPVAFEVGRLMADYIENLRHHALAVPDFFDFAPRWPIEAVAKRLAEGVLCDAIVDDRQDAMRRSRGSTAGTVGAKDILKAVPFFASVPDQDIEALLEASAERDYEKDEYVLKRGAVAQTFYVVMSGCVRLYRDAYEGDAAVLGVCTSAASFGGAAACLWDGARYPYSARTVNESRLIAIPAAALKELERTNPDVGIRLAQAVWQHVDKQRLEDEFLSLYWAPRRVGCLLLRLATGTHGKSRMLRFPYAEPSVAVRMGMKPETVSRALSQLSAVGVTMHGTEVVISDLHALQKFCCSNCPAVNTDCGIGAADHEVTAKR